MPVHATTVRVRTRWRWWTIGDVTAWRITQNGDLVITRRDLSTVSFAARRWRHAWEA